MVKNIILCSDGTGNSSAKAEKTNVWRLFQALDQSKFGQIAKYDNGVGTSSNKYLAAIGGAFGWGLKRIVLDLYKFVCRNWEPGDHIYGFGFSRGSFTIRVLVDFIATEGLITFRSDEELNRNAAAAYRHYRSKNFPSWSLIVIVMRWVRDALVWAKDRIKGYRTYKQVAEQTLSAGRADIPIRFLGLWDTVEAYGVPIKEFKRGIDWVLWPMMFGDLVLSPRVQRACHALSLDDERATFHPLLWDEVAEADMVARHIVDPGRITQVWFAGAHSNVGGGYPEDQLSLVALDWILNEAVANGVVIDEEMAKQVNATKSPYARIYDRRSGLGAYYRYAPRQIWARRDKQQNRILPIIHGAVVLRMAHGSDQYAPISLPHEFWVLAPDGELLPMEGAPLSLKIDATKKQMASVPFGTKTSAAFRTEKDDLIAAIDALTRPDRQAIRQVWDTVFWRQCVYGFTLVLTVVLAAYPWLGGLFTEAARRLLGFIPILGGDLADRWSGWVNRVDTGSRGPITTLVDAVSGFIPSYAEPWTLALEKHPIEFALIVGGVFAGLLGSNILQQRIHDRALLAWHKNLSANYVDSLRESKRGWRNGMLFAILVAVICELFAFWFGWSKILKIELGILNLIFVALLAFHLLGAHRLARSQKTPVTGTFALSVARYLRDNAVLRSLQKWIFERAVPIAFALTLVAVGYSVFNRALFDGFSAAGYFCKAGDSVSAIGNETRSKDGFTTDQMCWPSGIKLEEGQRYRITLTTPGNWFDQTTRTDVAGFPADDFKHFIATPLKRWWGQNWFQPIARIGMIGNDEYVLQPADPSEPHSYPPCLTIERQTNGDGIRAKIRNDVALALLECAPTPDERKSVTTEIKTNTAGELFLYVNDAVLMLPGLSNLFFSNNTGRGTVTVERITAGVP